MTTVQEPDTKKTTGPYLSPGTQAFIDSLAAQGGKPIYELSYADARELLETAQAGLVSNLPVDAEERTLPVGPEGSVSVTIFRPREKAGVKLPVVVYTHGAGWILGSKHTHDRLVRELTHQSGAAFVFVNYTRSPEAQFPIPVEQAYAATKYIAEHGNDLALDGTRLAIAGDSVGGNMATAVAMLAKERKGPTLLYQALVYPVTDGTLSSASYEEFADGPWLTKKGMEWFWNTYAPHSEDRTNPLVSPVHADLKELGGLPPTLIVTDENDVLRDEGEAYARKLMQADVDVRAIRVLATCHDFLMLNGLSSTPEAKFATTLVAQTLAAALVK